MPGMIQPPPPPPSPRKKAENAWGRAALPRKSAAPHKESVRAAEARVKWCSPLKPYVVLSVLNVMHT